MRWHKALTAVLDRVEHDAEMQALLGGDHVYLLHDVRTVRKPSVVYSILALNEWEVFEPFSIQWGVIASPGSIHSIHARLRHLARWEAEIMVGGMTMRALYEGGFIHPQPEPGMQHHSFDIEYHPVRARYYRRV